jgi:hypothetical protein
VSILSLAALASFASFPFLSFFPSKHTHTWGSFPLDFSVLASITYVCPLGLFFSTEDLPCNPERTETETETVTTLYSKQFSTYLLAALGACIADKSNIFKLNYDGFSITRTVAFPGRLFCVQYVFDREFDSNL